MQTERHGSSLAALLTLALSCGPAFAQQAGTAGYRLFDTPDGHDVNNVTLQQLANAIRQAQVPQGCPLGRLKFRVAAGDPIFQPTLANARRDLVLQRLEGLGLSVAGRMFTETTVSGDGGGSDTEYDAPRDRKPPQLRATSVPRKGSKVKPGDEIKVTMIARDDPDPWPTGLRQLQLVADTEGGRFIASQAYPACGEPAERRIEATYVVPPNPPTVVRLSAIADDHAGNMDRDTGEFPTYDWSGTLTWSMRTDAAGGSWTKFHGSAELVVYRDMDGKLSGMIVGNVKMDAQNWQGLCPSVSTATTTNAKAKLEGQHASGAAVMSLATKDVELTAQGYSTPCAGTRLPIAAADFAVMLHTNELRQQPDKTFQASGNTRSSQGGSTITNEFSLILRPAGD